MKRRTLILSLSLSALAMLFSGCESSPKAAAPAATEEVDLFPDLPPVRLLTDFEGEEEFETYTGPSSKIAVEISSEQAKSGSNSVKVSNDTRDWAGAILMLKSEQADWTGYNYFKMWVYGSNSGKTFFTDIEELNDGELFRATFKDDFEGWKQLEIDLRTLKSRGDYQNPGAKANGKLEYPLKTVQFCCTTSGTFDLYFDDFTVEK